MFPKITLIAAIAGAALVFAVPAYGDSWYLDVQQSTVRVSPDTADYAAAAKAKRLAAMLDARERAFVSRPESRSDIRSASEPLVVTQSGGGIEWSQIGVGFGLGLLLAFGLVVGRRFGHIRQPAH
jgi:hypothetical protein